MTMISPILTIIHAPTEFDYRFAGSSNDEESIVRHLIGRQHGIPVSSVRAAEDTIILPPVSERFVTLEVHERDWLRNLINDATPAPTVAASVPKFFMSRKVADSLPFTPRHRKVGRWTEHQTRSAVEVWSSAELPDDFAMFLHCVDGGLPLLVDEDGTMLLCSREPDDDGRHWRVMPCTFFKVVL